MRRTCLECVAKHLGSAAVYIEECELGYPDYFGFAYGELAHASSECLEGYPELSRAIREHRIKWANSRHGKQRHTIPFEAMFAYIDTVEEAGTEIEVPAEVYAGLDLGEDGRPVFSMDTRPAPDDGGEAKNRKRRLPMAKTREKYTEHLRVQGDGGGKRKRKRRRHRH